MSTPKIDTSAVLALTTERAPLWTRYPSQARRANSETEMQISAAGGETYEVCLSSANGERDFLGTIETPAMDEDDVIDAAREEYGYADLPARIVI